MASGTIGAPSRPCTTRAAMSRPTLGTTAQAAEASTKPASAACVGGHGAEPPGQPRAGGQPAGQAEQVTAQRPGRGGQRGVQVGDDDRHGHVDHRGVDHREHRAGQQDQLEHAGRDAAAARPRPRCRWPRGPGHGALRPPPRPVRPASAARAGRRPGGSPAPAAPTAPPGRPAAASRGGSIWACDDVPAHPDDPQPVLRRQVGEERRPAPGTRCRRPAARVGVADHRLEQVVAGVGEPVHVARRAARVSLGGDPLDRALLLEPAQRRVEHVVVDRPAAQDPLDLLLDLIPVPRLVARAPAASVCQSTRS